MKLYVNRRPFYGPFGGGAKFVNALYERLGDKIVDRIEDANTLLIAGMGADNDSFMPSAMQVMNYANSPRTRLKKLKIITRVNDCDARKDTHNVDGEIAAVVRESTHVVYVSEWMCSYFANHKFVHLRHPNTHVIINGCDKGIFKDHNNKLSRVSDKVHIVSHSWSDNKLKGEDVFAWLDEFVGKHDDFEFTFIGRTKAEFKNSTHVEPLCGIELGRELSKHDVYVFASNRDPGPNVVLESISCGLPTYVLSDGGGAIEFAGDKKHVYDNMKQLERILLGKKYMLNDYRVQTWDECINSYLEVLMS
jgi:glycosyltransferase involved in cell wall biosynthesis